MDSTPTSPTAPSVADRLEVARRLVRGAGELAMDYFARVADLPVTSKGPQDFVSEADRAVEALLRDGLREAFPGDSFLGEETGRDEVGGPGATGGLWVVDPIDGTQPFLNGLRTWCVSVAYVEDGRVVFGLVLNPSLEELFEGGPTGPATLNGRPVSPAERGVADGLVFLGASSRDTPETVVPVLDRLLRAGGMYVRNGSGALGLCDVAAGRLVGYVESHINAWDCLGAIGVLQAAGARVCDYLGTGGEPVVRPERLWTGGPIVAATPAAYDDLVAVLGHPDLR